MTGVNQVGSTLTASNGTWTGTPDADVRRTSGGAATRSGPPCTIIGGALAKTYKLVVADEGKRIRVAVTATNGAGSATAVSNATAAVTPGWDTKLTSKPAEDDAREDGHVLLVGGQERDEGLQRLQVAVQARRGRVGRLQSREDVLAPPLGTHTFRVRAGQNGVWDRTPAVYTWRVNR